MSRSGRTTRRPRIPCGAGKYGLIGFNLPEKFGGGGVDDFRFNAVIVEEFSKFGSATPGVSLQNDIVGPYFANLANAEQQARWLPGYIAVSSSVPWR